MRAKKDMKKIEIRKIQVEDLYVSPLAKRTVTNAEGWTRMEEVEKKAPPTGSLVMDAVAEALAEEPGLTTDKLAKALGTNSVVLNHIFKFLTGKLTRDFLMEYRLKRACELLACTNLHLEEIARRSQESDVIYFAPEQGGFQTIADDQRFYLDQDGTPVIVFEKYEIAPGYMGEQEFRVPVPGQGDAAAQRTE